MDEASQELRDIRTELRQVEQQRIDLIRHQYGKLFPESQNTLITSEQILNYDHRIQQLQRLMLDNAKLNQQYEKALADQQRLTNEYTEFNQRKQNSDDFKNSQEAETELR